MMAAMRYAHPEYVCDTAWLADHLDDPRLRLFDVTGKLTSRFENRAHEECYDAGHIPGAAFLDVASAKGVLSDPAGALPWTWPGAAEIGAALGRHGVGNDARVVLYAATARPGIDNGTMWCTRAWWIMHHAGVDAAVLDGGFEKWRAEGRPVSATRSDYPPATFRARPGGERARAGKADVLHALTGPGGTCVVDALSAESYAGRAPVAYGPRKGHITGAVNVPMRDLLDIIALVLILLGVLPTWPHSRSWGYYPSGGLGLILIIIIVLLLLGRI